MKFKFSIPPHAGNARATIRSQLGPCPFSPGSSFRLAGAGLLPRRPLHTGIPAALAGTSSLLDRPDDVSEPAKLPSVRMLVLLEVGGMTCAGCTTAVRRTLADAFGVENVSVNFANATAAVEVDAPSNWDVAFYTKVSEEASAKLTSRGYPSQVLVSGYRSRRASASLLSCTLASFARSSYPVSPP